MALARNVGREVVRRAARGMWLHQLAEYGLGFGIIISSAQQPNPAPTAICGVLVVMNAAVAVGPFSAFRWIGHQFHLTLDVVLIWVMLGAAWFVDDPTTRFMLVAYAALLGVIAYVFRPRDDRGSAG
jgi:hypothetical protein